MALNSRRDKSRCVVDTSAVMFLDTAGSVGNATDSFAIHVS